MKPRTCICLIALLPLLASSEGALAFVPSRSASCSPPLTTPCSPPLHTRSGGSRLPSHRGTGLNMHSANEYLPIHRLSSHGVDAGTFLNLQNGCDQPLLHTVLISNIESTNGDGGNILSSVTSVLTVGFLIAAVIFVYANVVYTPEIIENARAMRQEEQTEQILALVKQIQKERGVDGVKESRDALENVFGTTVEGYVDGIDRRVEMAASSGMASYVSVSEAEKELADLLRSIYL